MSEIFSPDSFCGKTIAQAKRLLTSTLSRITTDGEAAAIAQLALEHVTRYSPVELALHGSEALSDFTAHQLADIALRLLNHEPIQYILGVAHWSGLDIEVTPAVLIPRPETAQLVDIITDQADDRPDLKVLDICTGSGCIATALALRLKFPTVTAIDISAAALEVARRNAKRYRVKIEFVEADALALSAPPTPLYDIIVSNPPYIASRERADMDRHVLDFEPDIALFVPDDDPLRFYRAILHYAAAALKPDGRLYFEINPNYGAELAQLARQILPDGDVTLERDLYGRLRFLIATKS